ncbi:oligopeptide transporter, OPT family [soil metagenome]
MDQKKSLFSAPGEMAEFTFKAVFMGVILGVVFGAANAYTGLKIGMTVSASIPAAVMTVAIFKLLRLKTTILEANMSQCVGSASTALATGLIFTIPALFLWGMVPGYLQLVALAFLGGVLGISAMIPLRRMLVHDAHHELPFPEGTACAEVLKASVKGGDGGKWILYGLGVGMLSKIVIGLLHLFPEEVGLHLPQLGIPLTNGYIGLEIAPISIAVGFILGYIQSGVIVSGSIIAWLVLIPLISQFGAHEAAPFFPEKVKLIAEMSADEMWSKYIRYIGAGAVAAAGIATMIKSLPGMIRAFGAVAGGLREGDSAGATQDPTDRDLPMPFVVVGIMFVVLTTSFVPGIFAGNMHLPARLICGAGVGLFGVMFVAVAARIVGLVGVSSQPTSGIALVTIIGTSSVFAYMGWTDGQARAAVLTVGTVVAIAASKAGDISQDMKTGYLVGATPYRMQFGQLIGASFACWAVAGAVLLLGNTYEFGGKDLPAPQATLMKTVVEGVLAGQLPWDLVLTGVGLAAGAMLLGVSGLAFAIGVYLPLSSMLPIFVGGVASALAFRSKKKTGGDENLAETESNPGILAASGIVAGEALGGLGITALVAVGVLSKDSETIVKGVAGEIGSILLVLGMCAFLIAAGRSKSLVEETEQA